MSLSSAVFFVFFRIGIGALLAAPSQLTVGRRLAPARWFSVIHRFAALSDELETLGWSGRIPPLPALPEGYTVLTSTSVPISEPGVPPLGDDASRFSGFWVSEGSGMALSVLIYDEGEGFMDTSIAARRTEDIALDLLKFIASTTNVVKSGGGGTPGFGGGSTAKSEDQVTQLLDLYSKCRQAVEAPAK